MYTKEKNIIFEEFLESYSQTINICKEKFRIPEDLSLSLVYSIMNKKNTINNLDGYIYTSFKHLRYTIHKKAQHEHQLNQYYSKNDLISDFHSDLNFYDLINSVDKISKKILTLKFVNGLTIREISKELNIPKSTIQNKVTKSYKKIAKYLN